MFDTPLFHTRQQPMSVMELVGLLVNFFDETHVLVLAMLAFISHQATVSLFGKFPWQSAAKFVTAPLAIVFAFHAASIIEFQTDVLEAFTTLIRCGFAACLIQYCVSVPLLFILHLMTRSAQHEWDQLREYSVQVSEWYQQRSTEQSSDSQPVDIVPREIELRRITEQARIDYDFECLIIESADLEDEEKEAALNQAKQKYLQRLSHALQ